MVEIGLSVACWDYDRTRPILDGRVGIEGCRVIPVTIRPDGGLPQVFSASTEICA